MKTSEERFWSHVNKTPRCWVWIGGRNNGGYGFSWFKGKVVLAHRMSWHLFKGKIPVGVCVLHKCDNPPCVNPGHLFLGTQKDNLKDCWEKGRRREGGKHGNSKLTNKMVREIRKVYTSGKVTTGFLAMKYKVSQSRIWQIVNNFAWKHLK